MRGVQRFKIDEVYNIYYTSCLSVSQFTGKIVSALSSIHWCTKSFVRAVERTGTNSYCDRTTQITDDLFFFLLPFFLFYIDEHRRILANCIDESHIIELFATARFNMFLFIRLP